MKKSEWLAGLGILGACALCCALPLLGGAAVLGISSFFLNPVVIVILALVLITMAVVVYQRRKANGTSCIKPGCSCNSCASGRS
ncbi:hypothetical protein AB4114_24110 [Paenibacillus sp. 2RAB27]|uniref:hypothetical protein n=1 Tax=Paenibacillus sp. 2RAB27 TaxID=3232991 RepID=UPI003F961B4C